MFNSDRLYEIETKLSTRLGHADLADYQTKYMAAYNLEQSEVRLLTIINKLTADHKDLEKRFNELYNFTYLLADECGCDIQWKPAVEAGDVPVKRSKR